MLQPSPFTNFRVQFVELKSITINQFKMKKIFCLALMLVSTFSYSQNLQWDSSKSFDVTFEIENVYSSDGVSWELSVSGEAGPYGMGYGTITFSNFATDETQGEYFGYFLTQVQDNLFRGTTNGIWKKEGSKIKTYAYDNDKVGSVINLATGTWDLVSRKAKFTVAPLVD